MTATEKLTAFCDSWTRKDYKKMYQNCQLSWKSKHSHAALKKLIPVKIQSFEILEEREVSPFVKSISLKVQIQGGQRELCGRMLQEIEPYAPSDKGEWGVNPISLLRGLYSEVELTREIVKKEKS